MEELGGLRSMGSQRVRHNWVTFTSFHLLRMEKGSQGVFLLLLLSGLFIWLCCVLVAVCRLSRWANGFSHPVAWGISVPQPQIEPPSPALQSGFLATGPRGKSHNKRCFKRKQITNSVYMGWRVSPWIYVLPDSQNHNLFGNSLCRCSHKRFSCLAAKLCLTSVHGISQVRIPEWVAISFSRRYSGPRDQTCIFYIGRRILYSCATWETP